MKSNWKTPVSHSEQNQLPGLVISRCSDPSVIQQLLTYEYYDLPVCQFPERVLMKAGHWLAKDEAIYFVTAEVSGEVAGYVLAHTYGPMLWKKFGLSSIGTFISTIGVYMRTRLLPAYWQKPRRSNCAAPILERAKLAALQIEHSQVPFAWTRPNGATAYIEMLQVKPAYRGQRLAQFLLQHVIEQMRSVPIRRTEAHIDADNYASVRTFVRANWQVVKRKDGDFYAYVKET